MNKIYLQEEEKSLGEGEAFFQKEPRAREGGALSPYPRLAAAKKDTTHCRVLSLLKV